jgi:hypothetical protein
MDYVLKQYKIFVLRDVILWHVNTCFAVCDNFPVYVGSWIYVVCYCFCVHSHSDFRGALHRNNEHWVPPLMALLPITVVTVSMSFLLCTVRNAMTDQYERNKHSLH